MWHQVTSKYITCTIIWNIPACDKFTTHMTAWPISRDYTKNQKIKYTFKTCRTSFSIFSPPRTHQPWTRLTYSPTLCLKFILRIFHTSHPLNIDSGNQTFSTPIPNLAIAMSSCESGTVTVPPTVIKGRPSTPFNLTHLLHSTIQTIALIRSFAY